MFLSTARGFASCEKNNAAVFGCLEESSPSEGKDLTSTLRLILTAFKVLLAIFTPTFTSSILAYPSNNVAECQISPSLGRCSHATKPTNQLETSLYSY